MKKALVVVVCLFLFGCAELGIKSIYHDINVNHANREQEIEEAYKQGEISRKEYLDMKLRNDEIRAGNSIDVNVR